MPKFCHECGKEQQIGAKFCSNCGTNLTSLANTVPPPPQQQAAATFRPFTPRPTDEDDDTQRVDTLEHLDIRMQGLQVEIIKDRPMGETVASVFRSQEGARTPPEQFGGREGFDPATYIKEFQKEAGTLRNDE